MEGNSRRSFFRVTWSHALALDCIRDILCLQFVQKTRGVDVCVLPSKDSTGLRHAQKWQYSFRGDYVHVVCFFNSHCFTFSLFLVKTKPSIRVLPHLKNESIFVCIFHLSSNCLPPNHQNWAKMAFNLPRIWCYSSWNTFIFVRILIHYLIIESEKHHTF